MTANSILMRIIAANETPLNNNGHFPHKKLITGYFSDYAAIFLSWLDYIWLSAAN
jgi:hypothetical protein